MPEAPHPKAHPHPRERAGSRDPGAARRAGPPEPPYCELEVTSNFTFLRGASHPDELVQRAAELGYRAIALTDTNTLAGVVRAHVAAKDAGIRFVLGSRLALADAPGSGVLVYPTSLAGYGNLCRLLTIGKRRAPKGRCVLSVHDLAEHSGGLLAVFVPPALADRHTIELLHGLRRVFDGDRLSVAISRLYRQDDAERAGRVAGLAEHCRVPLVATNAVRCHTPERRALQDVLACIRHRCTIEQAGYRLLANAERHLKPPSEMHRLHADRPGALARALEIAERTAGFSLDQLRYEYPEEVVPEGSTAQSHLESLTWRGAAARYPAGVPEKVRGQIRHELALIAELKYAPYFLTVEDIVSFARGRGILCQGRGAAANSAVCYCLGVTAVDPDRVNVLFERFVSRERAEPPDIDIDFEHERREEVIQYLYRKYGRDRAALTAEVISFRGRLAIREVGRAMGLPRDCLDRLAKEVTWWDSDAARDGRLRELGLDPRDPHLRATARLANELMGFPRHLSQHVGGFVITRTPLDRLVPIENAAMADRTVIEWDKDDIEALGMLKVDVLGLGMLTCVRKALDLAGGQGGGGPLTLAGIPPEDPLVYDMICRADTVGVFQIESRAQMSMLPRLRPRCYYDLVIEVAIVRPGPIQGDMVHPYLRRRGGEEPVVYFNGTIERVLGRTLGVPLFQEQAMSIAVEAAGFTPGEADELRRAIGAWKTRGNKLALFGERILEGMVRRGYPREFAAACFEQIKGFSGYGFPESHAASFALLVYASAWLKRHHPAAFAAALLNSQPMGFYQPAQIVRDAREHGVEVRPIDVNHSRWDCTLEPTPGGPAVRLGMRLIGGLPQGEAERVSEAVRAHGPFRGVRALWRSSGVRAATLRRLAAGDAFGSMGLSRQAALWAVRPLSDEPLPLFDVAAADAASHEPDYLPTPTPFSQVEQDYAATGLSLRPHPMSFVREELEARGVARNGALADAAAMPAGRRVSVAGLVLVRQRPGTASGVLFMTIEDETGVANLVVWPRVYERYRAVVRHSGAVLCTGTVQRGGAVVHVVARSFRSLSIGEATPVRSRAFH
ncbi:MAG: error-prone DNA polymerase [Phycisphaerales bacterium]|nr:error-prone DNA polymerase [Phycisphaerales bacterium]